MDAVTWFALQAEVEKRVNEHLEVNSENITINDFLQSQPIGIQVPIIMIKKPRKKRTNKKSN